MNCLAAILMTIAAFSSEARAQAGRPGFGDDGGSERGTPAAQFACASFTLMGLMLILCMPSRKRPAA
jgi:hypothetical protein